MSDWKATIENTESLYQNLTFKLLFMHYENSGLSLKKSTFKENLGLLTTGGKYNILAQLLSDNSHISIRFGIFSGQSKSSTLYAINECGNTCILNSLESILQYGKLLNIPQADERNRVVERVEVPLFDEDAFREAAINAFVHNQWVSENAPIFYGFQNRIEILSFGDLPPGQTIKGFYSGKSVPVNPKLAEIFLQLHISERMGRGVPQIVDVYGEDNISISDESITVSIPYERMGDFYPDIEERKSDIGERKPDIGERKPDIEGRKPDIGERKPDIGEQKPDIDSLQVVYETIMRKHHRRGPSIDKMLEMLNAFGLETVFGRENVIQTVGGASSSTSALLQILLELGIIVSVDGQGKGKYRFNAAPGDANREDI